MKCIIEKYFQASLLFNYFKLDNYYNYSVKNKLHNNELS